jgi:rhodanese-related sulfurtransferase
MGLKPIPASAVHQMIEQSQPITVIDVNARTSWLKARVPNALNMDPERLDSDHLPPDKHATLVFYCSNPLCRKAPSAARRAKQLGYKRVFVMSTGIRGWLDAGLPVDVGEQGEKGGGGD